MEPHTILIGQATYEVEHVFLGKRSVSDLVLEQLTHRALADPAFDAKSKHGV